MVKDYETETGYYEYVDTEGYTRIGKWEQRYVGDRGYHSPGDRLMNRKKGGLVDFYPDEDEDEYAEGQSDKRRECPHCLQYGVHNKLRDKRNQLIMISLFSVSRRVVTYSQYMKLKDRRNYKLMS